MQRQTRRKLGPEARIQLRIQPVYPHGQRVAGSRRIAPELRSVRRNGVVSHRARQQHGSPDASEQREHNNARCRKRPAPHRPYLSV